MTQHSLNAAEFAFNHSSPEDVDFNEKIQNVNKLWKIAKRILVLKTDMSLTLKAEEHPVPKTANIHISKYINIRKGVVISKGLLKPGDIVAITKSFVSISTLEFQRQSCRNCGNRVSTVKIPCKNCTYATFCSEECERNHWNGWVPWH